MAEDQASSLNNICRNNYLLLGQNVQNSDEVSLYPSSILRTLPNNYNFYLSIYLSISRFTHYFVSPKNFCLYLIHVIRLNSESLNCSQRLQRKNTTNEITTAPIAAVKSLLASLHSTLTNRRSSRLRITSMILFVNSISDECRDCSQHRRMHLQFDFTELPKSLFSFNCRLLYKY